MCLQASSYRECVETDLKGHDCNSQETSFFFFPFLMFGKHLELCDCYSKELNNKNSRCVKTKKHNQDKEDEEKKKWLGENRSKILI